MASTDQLTPAALRSVVRHLRQIAAGYGALAHLYEQHPGLAKVQPESMTDACPRSVDEMQEAAERAAGEWEYKARLAEAEAG